MKTNDIDAHLLVIHCKEILKLMTHDETFMHTVIKLRNDSGT